MFLKKLNSTIFYLFLFEKREICSTFFLAKSVLLLYEEKPVDLGRPLYGRKRVFLLSWAWASVGEQPKAPREPRSNWWASSCWRSKVALGSCLTWWPQMEVEISSHKKKMEVESWRSNLQHYTPPQSCFFIQQRRTLTYTRGTLMNYAPTLPYCTRTSASN